MRNIIVIAAGALAVWSAPAAVALAKEAVSYAQTVAAPAQTVAAPAPTVPTPQEQAAPAADAAPAGSGLSDLDALTFGCPKAALNAAAREAAKVRSQGTYQFAYFRISNDSHHAAYEVHFKSNYQGEADLMYCVAIYCQQGWDPKTTKASVTLMGNAHQPAGGMAHPALCGAKPAPVKRRLK